ncbi:hypothetical protein [Streptomyces halobius]|uniref:Uncharacterized protein n=1 Tax=Streptomyces halobius TaxID=2879846 RepID=A0ABY4MHT7_9ACTN|nr:hypothetical protein [Streptomyces halobius]UQA97370.1 hypothetical protein K9S39_40850 [Streptomyces halobius]
MPSAAETARKTAAAQEQESKKAEQEQPEHVGQVLHMHTAHAAMPVPYLTPDDVKANVQEVASRLPKVPTKNLLFYGGLGALTVAGALEWPIALAIGGATWVVRSRAQEETGESEEKAADTGKTAKAK